MPILLPSPTQGLSSGSSEYALEGSGEALSAGVDAVFHFNGLTFNDRSMIDKYRITEIDGLDDADVRDAREANPSTHGETAYGSFYGGRSITFTGRVEAHNLLKLRDMQQALKMGFNDLKDHRLYIYPAREMPSGFVVARKNQKITMKETQQGSWNYFRDFIISIRAADPRVFSSEQKQESVVLDSSMKVFEVENNGNFDSPPIFVVSGSATDTEVTIAETGRTFKLNGNVASGNTIQADVLSRTVVDGSGANRFDMVVLDVDWPELIPGVNTIQVTTTARDAGATFTVAWRDTWM